MWTRALTFALAAIAATGTSYALQISPENLLEASRAITRIIGLSPAGTEIWAKLSVERSNTQKFTAFDRIDRQIGEQLALDRPDKAKLAALAKAYAAEKTRFELDEQNRMIADAFQLSDADRKILGRFIVRTRTQQGANAPVLSPLP